MEGDWVEPVLVKRDDLCSVLYDHHGIQITVEGQGPFRRHAQHRHRGANINSKKVFNARVVDQRSLVYDE